MACKSKLQLLIFPSQREAAVGCRYFQGTICDARHPGAPLSGALKCVQQHLPAHQIPTRRIPDFTRSGALPHRPGKDVIKIRSEIPSDSSHFFRRWPLAGVSAGGYQWTTKLFAKPCCYGVRGHSHGQGPVFACQPCRNTVPRRQYPGHAPWPGGAYPVRARPLRNMHQSRQLPDVRRNQNQAFGNATALNFQ